MLESYQIPDQFILEENNNQNVNEMTQSFDLHSDHLNLPPPSNQISPPSNDNQNEIKKEENTNQIIEEKLENKNEAKEKRKVKF